MQIFWFLINNGGYSKNYNRSQLTNHLKSNYNIMVLKCHSILKFKIEEQHSNHSTDYLQLTEVFCVFFRWQTRMIFYTIAFYKCCPFLADIKGNQGHFNLRSKSEWCKLNSPITSKHLSNEIIPINCTT